jgi:hypothetical protein
MINENGAIFPSLLIGWYSCLLKSNVAKKVVAVQQLFALKALHIAAYVDWQKLAE